MTTRAISLLATVFVWFVACSSGTDSNPQPSSSATGDPAAASTSTGGSANSAGGSAGATTASSGGTGGGGGSLATPTLTFQVDVGTSYQGAITVGNSVDGWDMAGKIQLVDPDQDGVYVGTMELPADTFMEYKFIKGSDGNGTWEDVPLNCGLKTDVYINRTVVMPAKDTTLPVTDFSACPDATPLADCNNAPGRDVPVTIQGASLRVGNQALHMKGVAWSPTAVGSGPGYGHGDFDNYASIDVPLFVQAGINTVRTYGPILNRSVLDKLYSEGIYVVNTVFYGYEDTVTSAVNNLCAVKDHPAIIAWVVGNEWNYNYNDLGLGLSFGQARAKVAEVVNAIQAQDSTRPVSTVYGEMPTAETYAALSAVDLWGLNVYRGASFGDLFTEWKKLSSKPMYVSEYGSDAYDGVNDQVDEAMQANIVKSLTEEIHANTSVKGSGVCAGQMVFSFADEWWKYSGGSWSEHDTQASWQNGAYADPHMNEEWWGLVDVQRQPRQAFTIYGQLTAPTP